MWRGLAPLLCVGLGGALGAIARYLITARVGTVDLAETPFPAGTLTCNFLGCLIIGALLQRAESVPLPDAWRLLLVTGLLGALTTFSTFGWETLALVKRGAPGLAALNVGANVALALAGVAVGMALVNALPR